MTKMFEWPDGRNRPHRPVDEKLPELDQLLFADGHQVVVFEAPTGSGKTSRIGQFFLLRYPDLRIWMTQLKRPAVRANGWYIASELGQRQGELVGWQLRGETPVRSAITRQLLVIDQTLVNLFIKRGKLPSGLLVIDEAHQRSIPTDLLLKRIKELLPSSPNTRVIITSATIDTGKFSAYFDDAPVVRAHGRMWPVEVKPVEFNIGHHASTAISAAESVMAQFAKGELTIITTEAASEIMRREDELRAADTAEWAITAEISSLMATAEREVVTSGAVVLVLAGKDDIDNAERALRQQAKALEIGERVEIVICHSQVAYAQQDIVSQVSVAPDTLRFVCATDIIRDSVTPRDAVVLIDQLQAKRPFVDKNGVPHLDKIQISLAEANQGMGRVGRTGPGIYMPVSYKKEYPQQLPKWPQAAILREALPSVVLQVAAMGQDIRDGGFIDNPNPQKIETAVTRLIKVGALNPDGTITKIGRLLVQFTTDPEPGRALITAYQLGVLAEAMIAIKILDEEGIMFRPRDIDGTAVVVEEIVRRILAGVAERFYDEESKVWRKPRMDEVDLEELPEWIVPRDDGMFEVDCGAYEFRSDVSRYGMKWIADAVWQEFAAGTGSDFVAGVNAFRAFKQEQFRLRDLGRQLKEDARTNGEQPNGVGSYRWQEDRLFEWCQRHFVNFKAAGRVDFGLKQLKEDIAESPFRLENGLYTQREFDADALTKALASGLVDHVHRHNGDRAFNGPLGVNVELSFSSTCPPSSQYVLLGGARKITRQGRRGRTYHTLLADTAAPVDPEWLFEVMPQLCEPRLRDGSAQFDPVTGQVNGTEDVYYGTVVIKSYPVQVMGEKAAEVLAAAMVGTQTGLPAEWLAKFYRDQVYELTTRAGEQRTIKDAVRNWLVKRLTDAGDVTRGDAVKCDLFLTDEAVSEMLGYDYPEFRERIMSERPDHIQIGSRRFRVEYSSNWGTKKVLAKVTLPLLVARRLSADMLPNWDDTEIRIHVGHSGYTDIYVSADTVDQLAEKIETRRRELAWKAFKATHGDYAVKVEVPYGESLENAINQLPAPEIWDPVTGDEAYPDLVYYTNESGKNASSTWYIRWFRTVSEAEAARAQAEAKKREVDAAENERRNFDVLKAEAQALYQEVEELFGQIDLDRYQAYGLSSEEGRRDPYGYGYGLAGALKKAKQLTGLTDYHAQPTQALEALNAAKERILAALAYFAENEVRQPEAEAALAEAEATYAKIEEARAAGAGISRSDSQEVNNWLRQARSAFDKGDYQEALDQCHFVQKKAGDVLATAETILAAKARLDALVAAEYSTCPVCEDDIERYRTHYCDTTKYGTAGYVVELKRTTVNGEEIVRLEAVYNTRYNEYEVSIIVAENVILSEDDQPMTTLLWQPPSEAERELAKQMAEVQSQLDRIEAERTYGRVEGTFQQTQHGLQFEGTFGNSQYVDNRNDPEGRTHYDEGTAAIFACKKYCGWLDEQPQAGETWICTFAFQIAMVGGKPIIVVNPQVRSDDEGHLQAQLAELQAKAEELKAGSQAETEEESEVVPGEPVEVTEDLAAKLAEAMGGRVKVKK